MRSAMRNFSLALCLASFALFAGCKKSGDADKSPTPAAKAADPAPAPAAAKSSMPAVTASDIPECTALSDTSKKVAACAKITADDQAVDAVNVGQMNGVISAYQAEKDKDNKPVMQHAAASNCKDEDDKQKKQLAAAGC
jgi:hypothetical protein